MAATEPVYISYLNYIGSGAPADGDQITRDNSQYPLNTVYTDRDSGITYVRKATTKVAATDWQAGGGTATEVTVYQLKTTLTDAQVKALPTTSIELVPDMSAGQLPMVHGGLVVVKNSAGAYTNANINAYMSVVYTKDGTVLTDAAFLRTSNLIALTSAANTMFQFSPRVRWDDAFPALEGTDAYSPLENFDGSGLSLFIDNAGSGDFTGGNAANTIEVTVFYSIVDL